MTEQRSLRLIGRFLLLISLMFWQGGFMFYGGVVVPVGTRVLGSDSQQGFITQAVTNHLNIAGVVCLSCWAVGFFNDRRRVSKVEWANLTLNFLLLLVLVVVHSLMDRCLDSNSKAVLDYVQFGFYHKIYNGTSTVQWLFSLLMLFLAARRW